MMNGICNYRIADLCGDGCSHPVMQGDKCKGADHCFFFRDYDDKLQAWQIRTQKVMDGMADIIRFFDEDPVLVSNYDQFCKRVDTLTRKRKEGELKK